ncbi:MAG TPA: LPS export ABC transporter periplasmic protein LptC [Firmicutes bacterium]|nr:LPS export ABC transporter periplasmic protein LptC [Bacillota bacterium]
MKIKLMLIVVVLALIMSFSASAEEDLWFTVSEDGEMTGGDGDEVIVIGEEIIINQGKTNIVTQKLIYNTKTKVARAFGECFITNENMEIVSKEVYFDTEKKYAKLSGDVVIKQKRDEKEITITAKDVELWTETKDVKASGDIVIDDKEKVIYGDILEFSDKTGIAKLSGNIKLVEEDRTLTSPQGFLEANVDKGTYNVKGKLEFRTKTK